MILADRWHACATPAGVIAGPDALARAEVSWLSAAVPSTAAATLRDTGHWSIDGAPRAFDGEDWWWRTSFRRPTDEPVVLCFDGLATLADVWLNGALILSSDNMFVAHRVPVELAEDNEIVIRCAALDPAMAARKGRPRWRAPMIPQQQIRWFRTTLLGRMPGWTPPVATVGPWRPIRLEKRDALAGQEPELRPRLDGDRGVLELSGRVRGGNARLVVSRGDQEFREALSVDGTARVEIPNVERWWPHSHGEPALYRVRIESSAGTIELGSVGFREITVDQSGGGFAVRVNGVPVFCRGANWMPLDPIGLGSARAALDAAFARLRQSGMNMLRVSGTMVYESTEFYEAADAAGVLIWQDFMFANLDYPDDDPAFAESVAAEARQFLARVQARASLAILCGNSEGEQQAAMWGAARDRWAPRLFHETLPALANELCPDVCYWPSSAHGGAFPHANQIGTTSYYGVGAYLRPLEDARRSEVRFASECLAFANLPAHGDPSRERTPRDLGAGWDFEDVRDHYMNRLYGVDPVALRWSDRERYLAIGRVTTGEVMAATFAEWRRARSVCRGGLVLTLRDLWPSAGWGLCESNGTPKPAWYILARALQPIAISMSDEGTNGLGLHVVNDRPERLVSALTMSLYRGGEIQVGTGRIAIDVPAHGALELSGAALFEHFVDLSYAYRFGPPPHHQVVLSLPSHDLQAFYFPLGHGFAPELDLGLAAEAVVRKDGDLDLTVRTRRFAQSIAIEVEGFSADDNYFHLAPGGQRVIRLRRIDAARAPKRGTVHALNADSPTRIEVRS